MSDVEKKLAKSMAHFGSFEEWRGYKSGVQDAARLAETDMCRHDGCAAHISALASRAEALTAQLAQRDAALKASDDLLNAVTHDREMVCQDYDMQFKASQSVERCLDAYRKARGQDA